MPSNMSEVNSDISSKKNESDEKDVLLIREFIDGKEKAFEKLMLLQ